MYRVEYLPTIPDRVSYDAALLNWTEQPLVQSQFDMNLYAELVRQETSNPLAHALVARDEQGQLQAALLMGPLEQDLHLPGMGVIVTMVISARRHPGALRTLMRSLRETVKAHGGDWYQTGKRIDELTFVHKYRRVS